MIRSKVQFKRVSMQKIINGHRFKTTASSSELFRHMIHSLHRPNMSPTNVVTLADKIAKFWVMIKRQLQTSLVEKHSYLVMTIGMSKAILVATG